MGSEGLGVPEGPLVTSSLPQGGCATFLCQPLDVLKTRLMNSKGEYQVKTVQAPGLAGAPAIYRHSLEPGPSQLQPSWGPRDKAVVPCSLLDAQLWVALASGWGCTFPEASVSPLDFFTS